MPLLPKVAVSALCCALLFASAAQAGQPVFPTSSGLTAPGIVQMCLDNSGNAVPVSSGTCAGGSGGGGGPATVANGADTVEGTIGDTHSQGTVVGFLKDIWTALTTGPVPTSDATTHTTLSTIATNTTGAATATNQSTANSSLATIATNSGKVSNADNRALGGSLGLTSTANAVTVSLNNGEATTSFQIVGLTGSGATLITEASRDGGTTWGSTTCNASLVSTYTADGGVRCNTAGFTNIRLRVSIVGTGSATVSYNAISGTGLVELSQAPVPYTFTPLGCAQLASLSSAQVFRALRPRRDSPR
jgi:hypothetical protein